MSPSLIVESCPTLEHPGLKGIPKPGSEAKVQGSQQTQGSYDSAPQPPGFLEPED